MYAGISHNYESLSGVWLRRIASQEQAGKARHQNINIAGMVLLLWVVASLSIIS